MIAKFLAAAMIFGVVALIIITMATPEKKVLDLELIFPADKINSFEVEELLYDFFDETKIGNIYGAGTGFSKDQVPESCLDLEIYPPFSESHDLLLKKFRELSLPAGSILISSEFGRESVGQN